MNLILWSILLIYGLLCIVCGLWTARRSGSVQKGAFVLVVCAALPAAGPLMLGLGRLASRRGRKKARDYSDFYLGRDFQYSDLRYLQRLDRVKEADRVPVGEALSLSDRSYRRSMIMRMLEEENSLQYLDGLQTALSNEDGETSHYASVVMIELRRKVQTRLEQTEYAYRADPGDLQRAEQWEEELYQVLNTRLYDEFNRRLALSKYEEVSDRLLKRPVPRRAHLRHRLKLEIQQKNYGEAQRLCSIYQTLYPDSEEAVLAQVQIFIATKDAQGLQSFLQHLRERPVLLTTKTLDYIRVFSGQTMENANEQKL